MTDEKENEEKTDPEFSLSGNTVAYSVEVRTTGGKPVEVCGELIGTVWGRITYQAAKPWEPSIHNKVFPKAILDADLLGWNAAHALMWVFKCSADRQDHHFIETRIVAHDVNYSVSSKRTSVVVNEGGTIGSTAKTGAAELDQYERNKAALMTAIDEAEKPKVRHPQAGRRKKK